MGTSIRWLAGSVSFFLPAVVATIAKHLDDSSLRHDPRYKAFIPLAVWSSLVLALLVPCLLVMRMPISLSRRIGLISLLVFLFLVQLYWIFFSVVVTH